MGEKSRRFIALISVFVLVIFNSFTLYSCGISEESADVEEKVIRTEYDDRDLNEFEFTVNNIAATDALGRVFVSGDTENKERYVGMFYFLWLGISGSGTVYDISDLLENDPDSLWSVAGGNSASPMGAYHFWGKPLFGYYRSDDEWVIRKHMEMFIYAGLDFLCFDTTNAVTYPNVVAKIFEVLYDYQQQGFKVPKIMYYTNTNSLVTMKSLYNDVYQNAKYAQYSSLWFAPNGKPMIVGAKNELIEDYGSDGEPIYKEEYKDIAEYFEIKYSQWPGKNKTFYKDGFPWIDFSYPQRNHNGVMSVSVAQHITVRMSDGDSNWGRGYDRTTFKNESSRAVEGLNYQSEWDTVLKNPEAVNIAFLTGWNEWIAIKQRGSDNMPYFVDTFNMEYSRDMEPMEGGYGDNFYLQTIKNIREYKYTSPKHYKYILNSPSGISDEAWEISSSYRDPIGDCKQRNSRGYDSRTTYTDSSGRNDIQSVKVTHDDKYLYVLIGCASDITTRLANDTAFMNVYIGTNRSAKYKYGDYNFVINRSLTGGKASVERIDGVNKYTSVGSAECWQSGNNLMLKVSLSSLGLSAENCSILFKVTDNVLPSEDFSSFYTTGDCAPIGRLSYSYGY